MLPITIFQISAALLLCFIVGFLGRLSRGFGYANLSNLSIEGNFGFNLVLRILSPSIYISFLAIFLYKLGINDFVKNIWLISLWYAIFNIGISIFLGKFALVKKFLYFSIHIISVFISYYFYALALSRGLEFILPEAGNFRTEIWLIILLFFYALLNKYEPNQATYYESKNNFLKRRYAYLYKHYKNSLLSNFTENKFLENLLFAIMIIEDINRNRIFRFFEKILFPFGFVKTTGIMQVQNNKLLSDEESVKLAQEKILELSKSYKDSRTGWDLMSNIVNDYNGGPEYLEDVKDAYLAIDENYSYNLYTSKEDCKNNLNAEQKSDFVKDIESIKDLPKMLNFLEKLADEARNLIKKERKNLKIRPTKIIK
jgi:hypothetical protein